MPEITFGADEIEAAKPLPTPAWYRGILKEYKVKAARNGESNNHQFKMAIPSRADRPFVIFINDTNPAYGLIPICNAFLGRPVQPGEAITPENFVGREIEFHVVDRLDESNTMRQVADQFRKVS